MAIIYADDGNAIAASATKIGEIKGGASADIFLPGRKISGGILARRDIFKRPIGFQPLRFYENNPKIRRHRLDFVFGDNALACGRPYKHALLRRRKRLLFHQAVVWIGISVFVFFAFSLVDWRFLRKSELLAGFFVLMSFFGGSACFGKDSQRRGQLV